MNILRRITKQVVHTITVHVYIYHGNLPNKLAATLTHLQLLYKSLAGLYYPQCTSNFHHSQRAL